MIVEDPSRTHLSLASVVELFESTNHPLVQPAGRTAQKGQSVVVAVDEGGALRVLVVLSLAETQENVLYSSTEVVAEHELGAAFEEAVLFAESMGFILDETHWPRMDYAQREQLASRLPAFRPPTPREPVKLAERKAPGDPLAQVARLFAAFTVLVNLVNLGGCGGMSAEQRHKSAEINYDLGTNSINNGDSQGALAAYLQSEKDDPQMPQTHNALGLLYGFSLNRIPDAEAEFKQAIELKPDFSEAQNNYGALLLSRDRFAEAIVQFQNAIANPLYGQRMVAQCNLAWALYKTGQVDKAVAQLRATLVLSPRFCKGWRQLGTIYSEKNLLDDAADAYGRYAESCPEAADAELQLGRVLVRQTKADEAKKAFEKCETLGHTADFSTAGTCAKERRALEGN